MSRESAPRFLLEAFERPLPGWAAQRKMISYARPGLTPDFQIPDDVRWGGVLVMIYPKENQLHTLLIKRPDYEGTHGGQVSFPGGKREESDPDLLHTALRETREETGAPLTLFEPLGELTRVFIPPSRFMVEPKVIWTPAPGPFHPDSREVEFLIETPLEALREEGVIEVSHVFIKMLASEIPVTCFRLGGQIVWGATAMMLAELREILYGEFEP